MTNTKKAPAPPVEKPVEAKVPSAPPGKKAHRAGKPTNPFLVQHPPPKRAR